MRLPGWAWRAYHRGYNVLHDGLARMSGACNAETDEGGYAHWRCMKARGHDGRHRFNNYVWASGARPEFVPLEVRGLSEHRALTARETPFQHITERRYSIDSRRRARLRRGGKVR